MDLASCILLSSWFRYSEFCLLTPIFSMNLIIATSNKHKLREFKELLKEFPFTILSLADFPHIPPIVEDGKTFYENALKKATTVAQLTGKLTIADDSGIEVEALERKAGGYFCTVCR